MSIKRKLCDLSKSTSGTASSDISTEDPLPPLHPVKEAVAETKTIAENSGKLQPPEYGSRDYWEDRYRKHVDGTWHSTTITDRSDVGGDEPEKEANDNNLPLPFHAWYFTYDDLRPILLPIILGGRQEARDVISRTMHEDDTDGQVDDNGSNARDKDSIKTDKKVIDKSLSSLKSAGSKKETIDNEALDLDDSDNKVKSNVSDKAHDSNDGDDVLVEVDEIIDDDDDDDEEEEDEVERDGLAKNGPISILEIGCGDVPLGCSLASELGELEGATQGSTKSVVKQIICTDYSETVIEILQKQYMKSRLPCLSQQHNTTTMTSLFGGNSGGNTGGLDDGSGGSLGDYCSGSDHGLFSVGNVPLQFETLDARKLSYPNESFQLVLEKGALDAMLSDKETGVSNCILTISECARVLITGGCLIIISHFNAHTLRGLGWLEEVVFGGLNNEAAGNSRWQIEVHGKGDGESEDESVTSNDPPHPNPAGPAVYVIHKLASNSSCNSGLDEKEKNETAIPVKFFSY